jgi:D-amino peptidase
MKVMVRADIEGITGIVNKIYAREGEPDWQRARRLMTGDINAAVEGALAAGATDVLVLDSHGFRQNNVLIEELHPEARLIQGTRSVMDPSFHAVLCVGFHARADVADGILSHTVSSLAAARCTINGKPFSEFFLLATTAGADDVPAVLVTGDQIIAEDANEWVPGIETVVVKKALGRMAGELLPPAKTLPMIREGAERALRRRDEIKPLKPTPPFSLKVEFRDVESAEVALGYPGVKRIDARKIQYECEDILEVNNAYRTLMLMANAILMYP